MPRSRRKLLFHVLSALAALVLASTAGEAYLRWRMTRVLSTAADDLSPFAMGDVSNRDLLIRHTPSGRRLVKNARVLILNHFISRRDVHIRTNALGFRGPEVAVPKPPGVCRVLVLGDSITLGDYLPEEEGWVAALAASLEERTAPGKVEAINAGVGDTGLAEQLAILEETGLSTEPDLVVLAFYLNDSRPPWGFASEEGSPGWLCRKSALAWWICGRLRLGRWVGEHKERRFAWVRAAKDPAWAHSRSAFLALAHQARADWGAAWNPQSWETVAPLLDRLKRLSRERGFSVAVACFPVAFQVAADFEESTPQRELARLCRDRGFAFLDLLPLLREHRQERLFFDHCHPTAWANRLIGRAAAEFAAPLLAGSNRPPDMAHINFSGHDRSQVAK
ncbi:MAG: hypothetical protein JRI97_06815 [Deltaproteobacteria bacterium]|nr:hypothetical protein [Deltaproteobacteria bacterium]